MMREGPFLSLEELDAYVGGPKIQCLECGRWFKSLATHIPRIHYMSHDDYRERWGIPKRYPLAGTLTRDRLSMQMHDQIDSGRLTYDHLPAAVEKARSTGRTRKAPVDDKRHRQVVAEKRPGDHHRLPPGTKRADGKDADRTREYQIAYRAKLRGDEEPMRRYIEKYRGA